MRWNRSQEDSGLLAEVNMAPLIDVSLVLVVILLLATPLAFESSFGVRKTAASARQASASFCSSRFDAKRAAAPKALTASWCMPESMSTPP